MEYRGTMQPSSLIALVKDLIEKLGVPVEDVSIADGQRTVVAVSSSDSKRLIGPHGEHLRALTMLARRMVETKHGEEASNFLIDVNRYYESQLDQVRTTAKMLAQRARIFKYNVEMSPMSSYERLVVHELFAEDAEIETVSEGEGKFRHIVLKYREGNSATV